MRCSRWAVLTAIVFGLLGASGSAVAQDAYQQPAPPLSDAPPPSAEPTYGVTRDEAPAPVDHARFRGGIALTGGGWVPERDGAITFGIDGRLGVQINDLVGLYAQPHLSFGRFSDSGFTGTALGLLMADFTIADLLVLGGGFGAGILHAATGPVIGLRAGVYPVRARSTERARRVGLLLSVESRIVFIQGDKIGIIMAAIGYEAF